MTELQAHLRRYNTEEELSFDEPNHRYYDKSNKTYTSVTQFLGTFEPQFDEYYWGMYTALKDNKKKVVYDKADIAAGIITFDGRKHKIKDLHKDSIYKHWFAATVAKWKGLTAEANFRGNNIHAYLEDKINESKGLFTGKSDNYQITASSKPKEIATIVDLDKTDLAEKYPFIYNRLKLYIEKDCIIYAEKRVKLDLAQLAGTIDVPIIKRGTNKFVILDWKTNKDEFKPTSGYMKKIQVGGQWIKSDQFVPTDDRFLEPISHLPLCKINTYTLQLSLYAYILECWGYEIVDKGLEIIHIRPGVDPKVIKIPYLKDEVEIIILHRLKALGIPFYSPTYHAAGKLI